MRSWGGSRKGSSMRSRASTGWSTTSVQSLRARSSGNRRTMDITTYLAEKRELVDSFLRSYFEVPLSPHDLGGSMAYSLFAGGKRLRPILALASHEACGGNAEDILPS